MKLTQELKRMLNALAFADASENLSMRQKANLLVGTSVAAKKPEVKQAVTAKPQVALYMGSELPADVIQYVTQTCSRLKHGLTVLTLQAESDARALLAPYQALFDENSIELNIIALTGEPVSSLVRALKRRPEVAFMVCNESGYLGNSLLKGRVGKDAIPVPVVMVTTEGSATQDIDTKNSETVRVA
jgi:hypothetical protein